MFAACQFDFLLIVFAATTHFLLHLFSIFLVLLLCLSLCFRFLLFFLCFSQLSPLPLILLCLFLFVPFPLLPLRTRIDRNARFLIRTALVLPPLSCAAQTKRVSLFFEVRVVRYCTYSGVLWLHFFSVCACTITHSLRHADFMGYFHSHCSVQNPSHLWDRVSASFSARWSVLLVVF